MGNGGRKGKLKRKEYEELLEPLELELVAMARWARATGVRIVVLFEGRDTAGKGGAIRAVSQRLNPRQCHIVALSKPSEDEQTQWYFQRYIKHLPNAGEIVLFDRSWYNRAGVEKVMGFADDAQVEAFLQQAPVFEKQLVDDGFLLFKYWLTTDQDNQEERLRERLEDPLKRWKLSPIDLAARDKYQAYTDAREEMLAATHTDHAPWTLVDFNDQKRGRLTLVRDLLDRLPDTHIDPPELDFPELDHEPFEEEYGVLRPIPNYSMD
ncbi:polyphosphate kinase 2 [Altererythrobacter lutimaris]|uniref:ADP/GDP-polyphosphate phosphotransferase n=1 Tax=Altererythrobacter lutimaris TaxID=2743979 RepID=A0A850HBS6_9SPHN|nr:polyphosphate kinase 2 [Altererythrobacter lutimaris]NVE95219.1 polyphosphate kinase 2 [Altererythrobacter lutimaris]